MPRNFFRRIEVVFPVEDAALRARIVNEILAVQIADNTKASILQPDGSYHHTTPKKGAAMNSQSTFMAAASGQAKARKKRQKRAPMFPKIEIAPPPKP